jgi:hypothetical protein
VHSQYVDGYVNSDGYTYRGGSWYYGTSTQAYYRTQYTTPGYWSCGRYYPGSSYYYYYAYTPPAVTYQDRDWRSKLLDIAAARDKAEAVVRKGAFEQQYFLESVKALGLEGNFHWNGYGTVPPYVVPQGGYGQGYMPYALEGHAYHNLAYGANATTQFSYSNLASLYGQNDMNALFQQAAQLAAGAQRLSSEATVGFQATVGQEGANRARVAEILARGQVAAQVLASIQAAPTSETKGISFKVTPGGTIAKVDDGSGDPQVRGQLRGQLEALIGAKCAVCHGGAGADGKEVVRGGLDLRDYLDFSPERKQKVWARISLEPGSPDFAGKVMPRDLKDESRPGVPLTKEERKLFFLN